MGRKGGRGGGGGGKGRGRGGRGAKGKGKGQKKRRAYRDAEEARAAGEPIKGKGKGKDKGKGARAAEEPEVPEPEPKKPRPQRPSFDALLGAFGVAESDAEGSDADDDDDDDDEESDQEGEEESEGEAEDEGPTGEGISTAGGRRDPEAASGGEGQEEEAEEEEEEEGEDDDEEEPAAAAAEADAAGARRRAASEGAGGADGLDFYSRFWEDPPTALASPAAGSRDAPRAAKGAAGDSVSASSRFSLPELSRCEARRRDVSHVADVAKSAAAVNVDEVLARCALAPGLRQSFSAYLEKHRLELGPKERALLLFQHAYLDVSFPLHTHANSRVVRAVLALHALDHVLKAKAEVLANTAAANAAKVAGSADDGPPAADLGFTSPRILVICPFRSVCHQVVSALLEFCPGKQHINKKRFDGEFGADEDEDEDAAAASAADAQGKGSKPPDWEDLFRGNADDKFRIGIALSRKNIRLYTPFDKSDILIASPLGLREITGADGEKDREFDFLSSIEVFIMDRADALRMQNWEHVQEVLKVINHKPQMLKGIDISRLRPAFAEGRGREFRQTVVTSGSQSMDAEAVFTTGPQARAVTPAAKGGGLKRKLGAAGRAFSRRGRGGGGGGRMADSSDEEANEEEFSTQLLQQQSEPIRSHQSCRGFVRLAAAPSGEPLRRTSALGISKQFFLHVPCASVQEQGDKIFEAFVAKYWKPLGISLERLLIVCNSYFSFLQLRRFFREEGTSFCSAFEYSKNSDLSRSRARFFRGERRVLLVTERFLWYRRYHLKGADYVLFYGPPETPEIYEEVLSGVRVPSQCNSMCLFTRQDGFALERCVGHERAKRMLASQPNQVFVFT